MWNIVIVQRFDIQLSYVKFFCVKVIGPRHPGLKTPINKSSRNILPATFAEVRATDI